MTKPKTLKEARLWRYEVDEVDWPKGDAPVKVGDILIDRWKASRNWEVHDFSRRGNSYVGSWSAKLLGEYEGPRNDQGYPVPRAEQRDSADGVE